MKHRPFDEADLYDYLWTHPMRAHTRQAKGFSKRRLRNLEPIQLGAQVQLQLRVETSSYLISWTVMIVLHSARIDF